jgi:hypothetical protein
MRQISPWHPLSPDRTSSRFGRPLVRPDPPTELFAAQIRRWCWHLPDSVLRWMDICNIDRRSRLARHLHDLLPRRDAAMDLGLPCLESAQSDGNQVPQDLCRLFLCDFSAAHILLHSTQSPPSGRRYDYSGIILNSMTDLTQHTPSTPSLNGRSSFSMSRSMRSQSPSFRSLILL